MYCTVKIDDRGGMDKAIQAAVSGLLDRLAWDDEPYLTDDYEITVHLNVLEGSVTAARRDLHE